MAMREIGTDEASPGSMPDDPALEAALAALRAVPPAMSDGLAGRLLADAYAMQPAAPVFEAPVMALPASGRFGPRLLAALGGWGAVGGLTTAGLVGVWIGFNPPAIIAGVADGVLGTSLAADSEAMEQVEFLPSFDDYLTEG